MLSKCWYSGKCKLENSECRSGCIRYNNMTTLIHNSGLPESLSYPVILYPEDIDKNAFELLSLAREQIKRIVNEGQNIYICSSTPGNGKTTWSTKILLSYFNEIWSLSQLKARGLYIYVPTLLNALKSQYLNNISNYERIEQIKQADLVVFDDLGVGKLSDNDINNLLEIFDYRLSNNKSSIFTSNLGKEDLQRLFGDRLTSRIYNTSLIVELRGSDRRSIKDGRNSNY